MGKGYCCCCGKKLRNMVTLSMTEVSWPVIWTRRSSSIESAGSCSISSTSEISTTSYAENGISSFNMGSDIKVIFFGAEFFNQIVWTWFETGYMMVYMFAWLCNPKKYVDGTIWDLCNENCSIFPYGKPPQSFLEHLGSESCSLHGRCRFRLSIHSPGTPLGIRDSVGDSKFGAMVAGTPSGCMFTSPCESGNSIERCGSAGVSAAGAATSEAEAIAPRPEVGSWWGQLLNHGKIYLASIMQALRARIYI